MLSFFPRDVLDEIWDLIESVSEGFPTYCYKINYQALTYIYYITESVCSGKGVGENVQHPFNCKLYITCIVDTTTSGEVIWSYVKQSSCSGDECWLPTGQCGTTQSPTTSTTSEY